MTCAAFTAALDATSRLVASEPVLREFAPWPVDAPFRTLPHTPAPVMSHLSGLGGDDLPTTGPLVAAAQAAAAHADWRRSYQEEEVGRDFMNRYGWFELLGPYGHFHSVSTRAYIAFWGTGLFYPWHVHEPEELYFVLAGEALFETEGETSQVLGTGSTRYHPSLRPHSLTARKDLLLLVLWRGAGLAGDPRMGRG